MVCSCFFNGLLAFFFSGVCGLLVLLLVLFSWCGLLLEQSATTVGSLVGPIASAPGTPFEQAMDLEETERAKNKRQRSQEPGT